MPDDPEPDQVIGPKNHRARLVICYSCSKCNDFTEVYRANPGTHTHKMLSVRKCHQCYARKHRMRVIRANPVKGKNAKLKSNKQNRKSCDYCNLVIPNFSKNFQNKFRSKSCGKIISSSAKEIYVCEDRCLRCSSWLFSEEHGPPDFMTLSLHHQQGICADQNCKSPSFEFVYESLEDKIKTKAFDVKCEKCGRVNCMPTPLGDYFYLLDKGSQTIISPIIEEWKGIYELLMFCAKLEAAEFDDCLKEIITKANAILDLVPPTSETNLSLRRLLFHLLECAQAWLTKKLGGAHRQFVDIGEDKRGALKVGKLVQALFYNSEILQTHLFKNLMVGEHVPEDHWKNSFTKAEVKEQAESMTKCNRELVDCLGQHIKLDILVQDDHFRDQLSYRGTHIDITLRSTEFKHRSKLVFLT